MKKCSKCSSCLSDDMFIENNVCNDCVMSNKKAYPLAYDKLIDKLVVTFHEVINKDNEEILKCVRANHAARMGLDVSDISTITVDYIELIPEEEMKKLLQSIDLDSIKF